MFKAERIVSCRDRHERLMGDDGALFTISSPVDCHFAIDIEDSWLAIACAR